MFFYQCGLLGKLLSRHCSIAQIGVSMFLLLMIRVQLTVDCNNTGNIGGHAYTCTLQFSVLSQAHVD